MTSTAALPRLQPEDVHQARQRAMARGHSFLAELEESSGLDPRTILGQVAALFGYRTADALAMHGWEPAFDLLPLPKALDRQCVLFRDGTALVAVVADPFERPLQLWLESRTRLPFEIRIALAADIGAYLSRQEESARAIENLAAVPAPPPPSAGGEPGEQLTLRAISADASPIVRMVNSFLYDALKAGASDIHVETTKAGINVKYRLDGVLDQVSTVSGSETGEQVISRIKVMAELDIAERRVPQDGRIKISARGRDIDLRVSIMPSIHGEDAVLRILDKHTIVPEGSTLNLEMLGFDQAALAVIRRLSSQPYGMLLVTGPTGSGKTTTLYGAISEINRGKDKIVTIEDPIEYELPGVLQIPVNEKKGLTFARGLRSILRHDPDKIMVGEIRDAETAEIAVQSALTGHLVLTTVHANDVFDVFNRFTHMGVDRYALTAALNGVWAQRLVRMVCSRCRGKGCGDCRGRGYRGRRAVAEFLTLDDGLRELIATPGSIAAIKSAALSRGTRFLREAALDLVRQGQTTLEEVDRVTLRS